MISAHNMWDESVYPNAKEFDPYRFLRMRENPGREKFAHCVSPSVEHMGWVWQAFLSGPFLCGK